MEKKWYAVYVKNNSEKKVSAILTKRKIQNYCPLNSQVYYVGEKKKITFEPLFKNIVFVEATNEDLFKIQQMDGVLSILYWLNQPAVIRQDEINTIKHFVDNYDNIKLDKCMIMPHGKIKVNGGSAPTVENELVAVKGDKTIALLASLGYVITADMESADAVIVKQKDVFKQKEVFRLAVS
ncbi:MAG: UpxY family transcription antiterminator [Bacteroidota bacterium]|nr:UpxY family transcription antiterminator [Bacteroidota bacterium]